MTTSRVESLVRHAQQAAVWRPSRARFLLDQVIDRGRNARASYNDADHVKAAAGWLARAQDSTGNGGVAGRFRLRSGWTSAYPETTGYIIPTFLALANEEWGGEFRDRARRCVEFLLPLQLESGAFPGGEIRNNATVPSFFNTAQIINGLTAWHRATGDERTLAAARAAADWLLSFQESDGSFRQHLYQGLVTTYGAHASCWIAELGQHTGHAPYVEAAARHMRWVLGHQDPETGWIDLCGFTAEDHAARRGVTHTIAYTLWGVLTTATIANDQDAVRAVERAALAIARRVELSGSLPGVLDSRWRAASTFACLTGNAQMALIWFALFERNGDTRLLNAALKAIDLIKRAQPMAEPDPGLRGGVPGSDPVWGTYIQMAVPNWAAKFYIDALLTKRAVLAALPSRERSGVAPPRPVPERVPAAAGTATPAPRVVVLASTTSRKVARMIRTWKGFRPAAVVVLLPRKRSAFDRIRARVAEDGLGFAFGRPAPARKPRAESGSSDGPGDPRAVCRQAGIPIVEVESFDSAAALRAIGDLKPDLFVFAGGAILRAPLLAIPRLGTVNAHMGLLPFYRGMNVAEWACFHGDPVGCTVHVIDTGIDTGDIVCARQVDPGGASTVAALRQAVDDAQFALLEEVVRYVTATGELPARAPQAPAEGRQFFRMHDALLGLLEDELARGRVTRGQPADNRLVNA